jgi:hypothetical protein
MRFDEINEDKDQRKQNALWAQITAHEKAAKQSKDIKRDHHLKMADQLRSQLKTIDEGFDYTVKDLGNDYSGFPSNHSMKHKFLAKIKPEKQQLYKDKMNNTHDWDSLFALFKVAKARGDIIEQGVAEEKVRLDPACWDNKKIGNPKTKVKGGVRVNNCVPKESVEEGEVVQFPKKHRGDISHMHTCPKCGGDLQGGKYQGHAVQVCMPCKQVYLPPNSGIDQQGNKIKEMDGDGAGRDGSNRKRHSTYGSRDKHNTSNGPDIHIGPDSMMTSKAIQDRALDALKKTMSKPENMAVLKRLKTKEGVAEGLNDDDEEHERIYQRHLLQKQLHATNNSTERQRIKDQLAALAEPHQEKDGFTRDELAFYARAAHDPKTGLAIDRTVPGRTTVKLSNRAFKSPPAIGPKRIPSNGRNMTQGGQAGRTQPRFDSDGGITEQGAAEDYNAEYDDEAGMAHGSLHTLKNAVEGLQQVIDDRDNLPEWCQEKISLAEDYLVTVWDYLQSEKAQGIDPELTEEFDLIESSINRIADHNGVDPEMIWEDLESLSHDELYVFAVTSQLNEDWQKANKSDRTDGMSRKAVKAYRRANPGSKLQTAVTTKPSKLKKGSKASKRRKSYCSRSKGQMNMHNISCAKTPDKAICKARRRWNC